MKKLIIKIVVIFILGICFIITNNISGEKYYIENDSNSVIQLRKLKLFIHYLKSDNYESAYEMLSDEDKNNKFLNINEFKEFINSKYINNAKYDKRVDYEFVNGDPEAGQNLMIYNIYFSTNTVDDYMKALEEDYENIEFYSLNKLEFSIFETSNGYKISIKEEEPLPEMLKAE